jgi:mono/diheme cytochrome c family protein
MVRWIAPVILLLALSACERPETAVATVSPARAEALYLQSCAICHGVAGNGRGPRRGSLYRKPPDFRDTVWQRGRSAAELRSAIREGRPGTDMPAWKNLDAAEVAGLAVYVRTFEMTVPTEARDD